VVDPLVWLSLSFLLVAVSLTAVLVAALPALQELARAARSAEKLFDTLSRELPPTLEAIRLTGTEITNLTDDLSQNVQAAGRVINQVDQSVAGVRQQAQQAQTSTRSVVAGIKAAWQAWNRPPASRRSYPAARTSADYLPPSTAREFEPNLPQYSAEPDSSYLDDRHQRNPDYPSEQ